MRIAKKIRSLMLRNIALNWKKGTLHKAWRLEIKAAVRGDKWAQPII